MGGTVVISPQAVQRVMFSRISLFPIGDAWAAVGEAVNRSLPKAYSDKI
jgi:hypothetical protein